MKHLWKKITAVTLALAFCLAPAILALEADQLKVLLDTYYIKDLPQAAREADTVEEVLAALGDPYTTYMTAEQLDAFLSTMQDSTLVGIGITAQSSLEGLLVTSVYDGSPAGQAGVVPGDTILSVNNRRAAGQPPEVISGWLQGKEGTRVTFTVRHANRTQQTYTVTRAPIVIPTTTVRMLNNGTIGCISCKAFGAETLGHVTQGVKDNPGADQWIVDLRNNGGGDMNAVSQVLGVFLGGGTMVYLRSGADMYFRYLSSQPQLTEAPVIALTSPQTASAAEVFCLGIKDRQDGLVIGSNTFGKGVAQILLTEEHLPNLLHGDALRVTSYQYYGLNGNTAQNIGIVPDLLVDPNDADEIAQLLAPTPPSGDKTGWLRVMMGGSRWYIHMDAILAGDLAPYLGRILSAIPPGCVIVEGQGSHWNPVEAADLAARYQIPDYIPRVFSDVDGLDCERAANTLRTYGMLLGYQDGTFRSDSSLTRAELCALLVQAMGLKAPANGVTFSDVTETHWARLSIQAACAAGYMNGTGAGRFDPEGTVTHEQLMTVLGRLAAELNMNLNHAAKHTPAKPGLPATYSDWAKPWVWLLADGWSNSLGLPASMLYDAPEDISPKTPATRGETAQILYTILNETKVIPY